MTAAGGARLPALDVLRGVAILLVFGRHKHFCYLWNKIGWTGVELFFVLSGFLIGGLLLGEYRRHGTIRIGRFLIRRGFKIYPAFYAFIAVSALVLLLTGKPFTLAELLYELFFLQNYFMSLWRHTWSLAVEEHFYLLLPVLLALFARANRGSVDPFRRLPLLVLAVALLLPAARLATWHLQAPFRYEVNFFPTHLRIDALLFGVLLAYLHHFHELARRARPYLIHLAVAAAVLLAPCVWLDINSYLMVTAGLSALYLGFGCLLLVALYTPWQQAPAALLTLARRPLRLIAGIGYYSYSIYLWHFALADWLRRAIDALAGAPLNRFAEFALFAALALGVGIGMHRLVEAPALALRDRLYPSRSRPLAKDA